MKTIIIIILSNISFGLARGQSITNQGSDQSILAIGYFNDCEGSDAANYTYISEGTLSSSFQNQLVQCNSNNQRSVTPLQPLARSNFPAGAFIQSENLYLVTAGPLQGLYIYEKDIVLNTEYLKKFSSILGYSYISTKSAILLINPKLDLNIFLAPTGAFEAFKASSRTICKGKIYAL